jgi:hypothetical protein
VLNRHVHTGRLPDAAAWDDETRHPAVPQSRVPRHWTARRCGRDRGLVAQAARTYHIGAYAVPVWDKNLLRELR